MRIPRIHIPDLPEDGERVVLNRQDSRYLLRVLRLRAGASVLVFDGLGREFAGELVSLDRDAAAVLLKKRVETISESPISITLAAAVPKGERMDYLLQKSVELGVAKVQPLTLTRSDVNLKPDRIPRRMDHWQGVMRSACEQCGRATLPGLNPPETLGSFLKKASDPESLRIVLHGQGSTTLQALSLPANQQIILITGPEGGLTDEELSECEQANFTQVRLGPRTMRAETAGPAAIAALQTLWGDLCS